MSKAKNAVEVNVEDSVVSMVETMEVPAVEAVEVEELEAVVDATPVVKKRRGKVPTKAQIHSVEDVVNFVRGNSNDEAVVKRLKEVFSAKFAEQKELIIDAMWPTISKATPKKQAWFTDNVTSKIRNARKPRF